MRMTCFGDLPTTALLIVHNTLLDEDNQYAAKFRCSCRAAHEGATLPPLLKVAFPLPPLKHTLSSLARLLHHPSKAKSTSLSVKIDDLNGKDLDDVLECLQAVSDHLTHLDLPVEPYTPSIRTMVSAVCKYLPQVQHLQLQLDRSTEEQDLVALVWLNHGGISIREADVNEGQLSTLVLRRAPGEQPFCFLGTTTPPLDLSLTPTLSHLVLQGPIVQDAKKYPGQTSLVLPPHTKVTIDPGLEGRAPTCWARNITVFDRFSDMPRDAIPDVETYREEDLDQRMLRVWAFTEDLIDFTVERKKNYVSHRGGGYMYRDFPSSSIRAFLEGYLGVSSGNLLPVTSTADVAGCGGRSDKFWDCINMIGISDALLWQVEMYERGLV